MKPRSSTCLPKAVGLIIYDPKRTEVRKMVRAGIPEKTAMERSGRKTRCIFNRYDIVSEKGRAQATERLEDYLASQPKASKIVALDEVRAVG